MSTPTTFDSLQNIISGMLTEKDKGSYDRFIQRTIDDGELEAMYRNDWVSRKIVDIPAFDMVREWRTWQGDAGEVAKMFDAEEALGIIPKSLTAKRWQRLYGGAGMIMGDGGDSEQPLDLKRIAKSGLQYLHVVAKRRLTVTELNRNLKDPNFGNPDFFQLMLPGAGGTPKIHHTRVVAFRGQQAPDTDNPADWWGDSILQAVYDAVLHQARSAGGFAALIHEATLDKVTTPHLNAALTNPDDEANFKKRFQIAALGKSLFGMLLLGEDETWEKTDVDFSNFEGIMTAFLRVAAGAADIPASRFLSQSPTGLNATGDGDTRNYYEMIGSRQRTELGPELRPLDNAVKSHVGIDADEPAAIEEGDEPKDRTEEEGELFFTWNSLWAESPKEKAETNHKNAQAAAIHATLGVLDGEVFRKGVESQIIEAGTYPAMEAALAEMEKEGREPEPLNFNEPDEDDDGGDPKAKKDALNDASPRQLYISRPVKNADHIKAWAKSQGFETTIAAEDMHVTIAFSRQPVDWFKLDGEKAEIEIEAGGPRLVERLGPHGAVVLLFSSWRLKWRHMEVLHIGGSHDWEEFQPHITLTYKGAPADLSKVVPYRGAIVLGPEKFEVLQEGDGWRNKVLEDHKAREG